MIGRTLGHYQITGQLGKGGMGEVYQAKDHVLGRDVAIKVLPEEFARDADRVARFQREAKLLASLNHPNIATIHGLEESDGIRFLVMEMVEGETLADRIKRGPIPIEESLKLALQIAEALEAAHEKGVIHRDLKPANVKVTPDGRMKVLDFGLAKAFHGEQEANLSNSPTLSDAATQQGVILGTAAYMSPEQAKGKPVDKRSDIWAFGVVLFEMLSGRHLFEGETVSETIAAVLMREPDFSAVPQNLHPRVRLLLERCLSKEPKNRCHDIADARLDLQEALADHGGVQSAADLKPRKKLRIASVWIAAIILIAIITIAVIWNSRALEPRQVIRFDYELPAGYQLTGRPIAVSPDGKQFVYSTTKGLFLRSVNELTAKLIPGSEGDARQPFFSPDGEWIGYYCDDDRQLKIISVNGGAPVSLCDVGGVGMAGASWGTDDTIVFGAIQRGIMRIPARGGTAEALIKKEPDFFAVPQILQDGKSLLYTQSNSGFQQPRIMAWQVKSGEPKDLLPGIVIRYLPNGYLLFNPPDITAIYAIPFDPNKLEVKGKAVSILEDVAYAGISDSGTLVYTPISSQTSARPESGLTLVWVDRGGKEEPLGTPPNYYWYPKLSPDGNRVAVSVGSLSMDIWIWDTVRKNLINLTLEKTREMLPIWSPDGKRIVYWADTAGASPNGVFIKPADGSGEAEKLISAPNGQLHPFSWSSDGKALLMQDMVTWMNLDVSMLSMEEDYTKTPLLQSERAESQPQFSPDGKWIAYTSDESGRNEVYVRPFPDVTGSRSKISTQGGTSPLWSPQGGRELFYLSEDNRVMAVAVGKEPELGFGTPKMLFKSEYLGFGPYRGTPWDIHPDGKKFLMIKRPMIASSADEIVRSRITVVLNWFEELKAKAKINN